MCLAWCSAAARGDAEHCWVQMCSVEVLIRVSDGGNLATFRGKAQRKLQHTWDLSLVETCMWCVCMCVCDVCALLSFDNS